MTHPDIQSMLDRLDPDHSAVDAWLDTVMPSMNLIASAISATLDPEMIVLGGRLPAFLASRTIERSPPLSGCLCQEAGMLRIRIKRLVVQHERARERLADIETSIASFGDEDILDLADIFKDMPETALMTSFRPPYSLRHR